jgi:hypothetical protein
MRTARAIAFAGVLCTIAVSAKAEAPLPNVLQVLGSVTNAARPVSDALVIALNLQSFDAFQTRSALDGRFSLPPLPAAVYRVIAVKHGFAPAIATVVPTKSDHKLALRLADEKHARGRNVSQEMWEIRGSLPPDILHELDAVLAESQVVPAPVNEGRRLQGEMVSMTGVSDQAAGPGFSQTALGVRSQIGESWQLGINGNIHRVDDPTDGSTFGGPAAAQSSVMSMELRSSPTDTYRLASTKSWWRYADATTTSSDRQADLSSHEFEWEHGDARVQVHYLAQQNLFQSNPLGSDLIEIAGDTPLLQTARNDLGVSVRVTQESLHEVTSNPVRMADLSANASFNVAPAFTVRYGLSSRLGVAGSEWAPRSGVEWKLTPHTSFIATGMYKILDQPRSIALPMVVVWSDEGRVLPHYAYSFGIVAGPDESNRVTAIGTVTAVDSPLRMVFTDGFEQFWDALYLEAGDVRRDLRVSCRKELGRYFAIDISTSAGTASPSRPLVQTGAGAFAKAYLTGDLQSTFHPSGTTLVVSYREIRQPQSPSAARYRSERMNVHVAQSLHLPMDLKLLLGLELARSENSPFLLDTLDADGGSRRYMGGLSVNF